MSAIISDCSRYRYRLERQIGGVGGMTLTGAVIMVNPSTADAEMDDATIRKLKGFAARWKWDRLIVGNLFAYRATDVRELGKVDDPVGPENDEHLFSMMAEADELVFAWGPLAKQPKAHRDRWSRVAWIAHEAIIEPKSIGVPAKDGHPKHPLMLAYDTPLMEWNI